jgi:hypothetical protein
MNVNLNSYYETLEHRANPSLAVEGYYASTPPALESAPSGGDLPDIQDDTTASKEPSKTGPHSWFDLSLASDPSLPVVYNTPSMEHQSHPAIVPLDLGPTGFSMDASVSDSQQMATAPEAFEQHALSAPRHIRVSQSISSRAIRTCMRAVAIRPKHS